MDLPYSSQSCCPADYTRRRHPLPPKLFREGDQMSNQIGERYRCTDPDCGCEVEIKRPCGVSEIAEPEPGLRPIGSSPELDVPPSSVSIPRQNYGLQEGAGERGSNYGSPKLEEGTRGPFRSDEDSDEISTATDIDSTVGIDLGSLICFCGTPMELSSSRSRSATAGAN
jgi:hypothetical protein